ncbi:monooxygenase-related protein [Skeletonema marinoi]|uniref:Monooxygenase-related protein n=1 Tax=Skeletonema marinoi TaxID=267567 RepID=A0AAD8YMY6_9STRA|nr:monooxygenase-related protein [Skeletonema marinoi]
MTMMFCCMLHPTYVLVLITISNNVSQTKMNSEASDDATEYHPLVIVGGGIGGLVLALCLDQQYNQNSKNSSSKPLLPIHVYESTSAYTANAGGAIGLYPNGLRVLQNLNDTAPKLLSQVREAGCDYIYRRWMRHDGLEVAVAREDELLPDLVDEAGDDDVETAAATTTTSTAADSSTTANADRRPRRGSFGMLANRLSGRSLSSTTTSSSPRVETELQSLGIRRWKYQQVLYEACIEAGIKIHFGKRLQNAITTNDSKTVLHFKDGSKVMTSLLIGADGINSKVRNYVVNPTSDEEKQKSLEEFMPEYTGVTCLMGCANVPFMRGICFPSSATSKCHACYYPTKVPKDEVKEEEEDNATKTSMKWCFKSTFHHQLNVPIPGEHSHPMRQKLNVKNWQRNYVKMDGMNNFLHRWKVNL